MLLLNLLLIGRWSAVILIHRGLLWWLLGGLLGRLLSRTLARGHGVWPMDHTVGVVAHRLLRVRRSVRHRLGLHFAARVLLRVMVLRRSPAVILSILRNICIWMVHLRVLGRLMSRLG